MEYTKKPKAFLINWTQDPIETMCYARRVMHSAVPDSIQDLKKDPVKWLGKTIDEYVEDVLLKDGMPTFLEYVNLTFKLENVSRALQQQLTRHRIGFSYSIQSLRCVDLPNFANNGKYTAPEYGNKKDFHNKMLAVQKNYVDALNNGLPTQDARGLLPMNIHSTVTFNCSLRAFIGMVNKRLCLKTQKEFRDVAYLMVNEIKNKLDNRILKWIGKPCDFGKCMMQGENEEQYKQGRINGKQNTDHVCPLYIKQFIKNIKEKKNE